MSSNVLVDLDCAQRELNEKPGDRRRQIAVIDLLIRIGATRRAATLLTSYDLDKAKETLGIRARIAREAALATSPGKRRDSCLAGAALYDELLRAGGGSFAAINAATLYRLAGKRQASDELARRAIAMVAKEKPRSANGVFFANATRAEAALLLDESVVRSYVEQASRAEADEEARVVIRRKLHALCDALKIDHDVIDPLAPAAVVHYVGHRLGWGFTDEGEASLAKRIADELGAQSVGHGFGSLASGADILFVEALLARGAKVDVILPFAADEFCEAAVRKDGDAWVARYRKCLANPACRLTVLSHDDYRADTLPFTNATRIATGMAILRSRFLMSRARQIAVWDGERTNSPMGVEAAVDLWARIPAKFIDPTTIISPLRSSGAPRRPSRPTGPRETKRVNRSMLFSDVKGFSSLAEDRIPVFQRNVMGALAKAIKHHKPKAANTWGDGIFLVFDSPSDAAACALAMQTSMPGVAALRNAKLPEDMALRTGGHTGPVFEIHDHIIDKVNAMGTEVTRTARIEPVTPPGEAFVTLAFAAHLALETNEFSCDYVGEQPMAKGYHPSQMYLLRRSAS